MKAVIFNSGLGKRMGKFTETHHKSQASLKNGETILDRQLRLLYECGITDFVITTGPHKEQIEKATKKKQYESLHFTFVENPIYEKTNYIYSMYLAKEYLNDDVLILHGDLVFTKKLLQSVLDCEDNDIGLVNKSKKLPEKDFKARIVNDKILEISVNIFDEDCFAFQPLYKLSKLTLQKWLDKIDEFIDNGNNQVYAENALNEIASNLHIKPFLYDDDYYIDEIDNLDDLERVSNEIRQYDFDDQVIFSNDASIYNLDAILKKEKAKKPMIVCGFFDKCSCKDYICSLDYEFVIYKDYSSNPTYEQVENGVKLFRKENCDIIISIGGGSAIDTAKSIKLFSQLNESDGVYVNQKLIFSPIKHICIPTTAGTGSESTRYSVVYYNGEKCSITHDCILPDYVILEPMLIETLSSYQKKCTVLDALCQCIEAMWSINTNEKCRDYAAKGISLILENLDSYLNNERQAICNIQIGANYSGKAINISQTTAAHALSYKLTSIYGIPHGLSVALCLPKIWYYMNDAELQRAGESFNNDKNIKAISQMKNQEIMLSSFEIINKLFGVNSTIEAIEKFNTIVFEKLQLEAPRLENIEHLDILTKSVNPVRLSNNPKPLCEKTIYNIYNSIFDR